MSRDVRRFMTEKIANKRLMSLPEDMRDQPVGRFRKWNMACNCKWCRIRKYCDIAIRRIKDYRRNG